ncbi:MAG TPA: DAK2 domain-containing protein, partial [Ilumatobacteraceae bacterium]|nr:DAK2 domain-containing protein [Ilumatobacteraceae bacterium]
MVAFSTAMQAHAADINRLNVYPVPDGDTGTNMSRTLAAVVAELDAAELDRAGLSAAGADMASICTAISHGSLMGARGNSGVILSQILRGLASVLRDLDEHGADAAQFATALTTASAAAYQAVLKPIEGTILTVVREASEAATAAAADGASLADTIRAARHQGGDALARTPDLLPVLRDAGVVDAGGAGFLLLLDAALHVVAGDDMPEPSDLADGAADVPQPFTPRSGHDGELDVSEQRYEVMYFLDLADEQIGAFKQAWGDLGDSIVVVGGDGLWNCHVHTNDIGAALEAALDLGGRPRQIRVTDLFAEVADQHAAREAAIHQPAHTSLIGASHVHPGINQPAVTCAIVAVSSGQGLTELFANLGVQGVISGGQTLNPSTAELLDAVEAVNSDQVVVLPNNKNIIPVAEQLDALTHKTVVVVPTVSMPEALAALIVYDPEADAAANADEMAEA